MENVNDYDDLIIKCLAGEADENERESLKALLESSQQVTERFLSLKNVWDAAADPAINAGIDTSGSLNVTMQAILDRTPPAIPQWRRNLMRFAAMLSIPLLALSAYLYISNRDITHPGMDICQEINAMPGSLVHTMLPDSTEVWINGGSSLRYTCREGHDNTRRVEMAGEIFFNVARDKERPFIVSTPSHILVEALGTQFNVRSYASDTLTSVTLIEGLVAVGPEENRSHLSPNNSMVYNTLTGESNLYLGNTEKIVSWRHGCLAFKNEPLKDVYKRLGQIYDVKFEVDPRLDNVIFYATFENASLDQILSLIRRSTPLKYVSCQDDQQKTITVTPL